MATTYFLMVGTEIIDDIDVPSYDRHFHATVRKFIQELPEDVRKHVHLESEYAFECGDEELFEEAPSGMANIVAKEWFVDDYDGDIEDNEY